MAPPLFILGAAGSLNSLVCAMIGQHPEMYGLPEVNLFAGETYQELLQEYGFLGRFQHGLWRAVAQLRLGAQTERTVQIARSWLENHSLVDTAELFQAILDWTAPRTPVDGSRQYAIHASALPRAQRAFPKARYLHLLRHPCSALTALHNFYTNRFFDVEEVWLHPHVMVIEFLETVPPAQHVQLRVEDLLRQPDLYLKQIAEWLDIQAENHMIEAMKHPELSSFADYGPLNARFGGDPFFLKNPTFYAIRDSLILEKNQPMMDSRIELTAETRYYAQFFGYEIID